MKNRSTERGREGKPVGKIGCERREGEGGAAGEGERERGSSGWIVGIDGEREWESERGRRSGRRPVDRIFTFGSRQNRRRQNEETLNWETNKVMKRNRVSERERERQRHRVRVIRYVKREGGRGGEEANKEREREREREREFVTR